LVKAINFQASWSGGEKILTGNPADAIGFRHTGEVPAQSNQRHDFPGHRCRIFKIPDLMGPVIDELLR